MPAPRKQSRKKAAKAPRKNSKTKKKPAAKKPSKRSIDFQWSPTGTRSAISSAEYAREAAQFKRDMLTQLWRITDGLAAATNAKQIICSYSGEGDSGGIEEISFVPDIALDIPKPLYMQLEHSIEQFLPSGFENGDGGYGTITIDIEKQTVTREHSSRYVEINESVDTYEL